MSTITTPAGEPTLFALLHQAAKEEVAAQEARGRAQQAEQDARTIADAASSADRDARCAFGEYAPDPDAWRGYPDRTALAYLGQGHWLRWSHDRYPHSGRRGDLRLLSPCPHSGHHERELYTLADLPRCVDEATRCDGGPLSACYHDRHAIPVDF